MFQLLQYRKDFTDQGLFKESEKSNYMEYEGEPVFDEESCSEEFVEEDIGQSLLDIKGGSEDYCGSDSDDDYVEMGLTGEDVRLAVKQAVHVQEFDDHAQHVFDEMPEPSLKAKNPKEWAVLTEDDVGRDLEDVSTARDGLEKTGGLKQNQAVGMPRMNNFITKVYDEKGYAGAHVGRVEVAGKGGTYEDTTEKPVAEAGLYKQFKSYDAGGWAPNEYNPGEKPSPPGQEQHAGEHSVRRDGAAPHSGLVWEDYAGFDVGLGDEYKSKEVFGSDDVPVDEDVRRQAAEVTANAVVVSVGEKIAPYASVIVNCMYWEKRFPRLLSTRQLQELASKGCPLIGVSDISCDTGGSIEVVNKTTSIDNPFFRYDPSNDSYQHDLMGYGVICLAVDILPTEFAKEASKHFGDILYQFVCNWALTRDISELPEHLKNACICHGGSLTPLYEYIPRVRSTELLKTDPQIEANSSSLLRICTEISSYIQQSATADQQQAPYLKINSTFNTPVKQQLHINNNEKLIKNWNRTDDGYTDLSEDIIEAAGGSFHLVKCQVGQNADAMPYSDLEVSAADSKVLDQIIDSLTVIANPNESHGSISRETNKVSLTFGKVQGSRCSKAYEKMNKNAVLIIGAGRVCRPAVGFLASVDSEEHGEIHVIVAPIYLKDAEEIIEDIANTVAVQLDVMDHESLCNYISQVEVVISLLPPGCHATIANACIELNKHLVTASYVDDTMSKLDAKAKDAAITILGDMGLDPGIEHMMAMKMINQSHMKGGFPLKAVRGEPASQVTWLILGLISTLEGSMQATAATNSEFEVEFCSTRGE